MRKKRDYELKKMKETQSWTLMANKFVAKYHGRKGEIFKATAT